MFEWYTNDFIIDGPTDKNVPKRNTEFDFIALLEVAGSLISRNHSWIHTTVPPHTEKDYLDEVLGRP